MEQVRRYWLAALVLLVGALLVLVIGFAADNWGTAGLVGGAMGIIAGAIIAAIQSRQEATRRGSRDDGPGPPG